MQPIQQSLTLSIRFQAQNHALCFRLDNAIDLHHIVRVDLPAGDEVVIAQGTGNNDDFVLTQEMTKLLKRFAKKCRFESTRVVIQDNCYAITTFADIHDQAGNRNFATLLRVVPFTARCYRCRFGGNLGKLAVDEMHCVASHGIERMSGQVETECFFLIGETFLVTPLRQMRIDAFGFFSHRCNSGNVCLIGR